MTLGEFFYRGVHNLTGNMLGVYSSKHLKNPAQSTLYPFWKGCGW